MPLHTTKAVIYLPEDRSERTPQFEAEGVDLLADPVYNFVKFTIPTRDRPNEITERDLINSPWLQRLREIYQLQMVRLVYPGGEHTRFQHVMGAMHLGGRFADRVYNSLAHTQPEVPSKPMVEETLRLTGLLHDVGHGPFGHFFDHNFLIPQFGITHEHIGEEVIVRELSKLVRKIRRSPVRSFESHERLDPRHIAYLINKQSHDSRGIPQWVRVLKPLVTGVYTIDNLDYVSRDSYACGLSTGSLFVDRLLHYSFMSEQGLTLHQRGIPALKMFLAIRAYLYSNVYFHRTVRAFDLHLKEIFEPTLKLLFGKDPRRNLRKYQKLTDQFLFAQVSSWNSSNAKKRKLAKEWSQILGRRKRWIHISGVDVPLLELPRLTAPLGTEDVTQRMQRSLHRRQTFIVDVTTQDTRPENLTQMGEEQFFVFEPGRDPSITQASLKDYFTEVPSLVVQCRVYARNRRHERDLVQAFEEAIGRRPSEPTAT
jgi:HD superfamily phosphohydrolase